MRNRILVVKIGGAQNVDIHEACRDVAFMQQQGYQVLLVHGGSDRANRLSQELGCPVRFIQSPSGHTSRYTDWAARSIYVRAVNEVNAEIEAELQRYGITVAGLRGAQCVLYGQRKRAIPGIVDGRKQMIRDDYSGSITGVDLNRLRIYLANGYLPLVTPLANGGVDGLLNVDGDRAAAAIAGALGASRLVLLSNVPGLLRAYPSEESLVYRVPRSSLDLAMGWAQGRMKRKVLSVREALERGVDLAVVADGRVAEPLQRALNGAGTRFS